MRKKFDDLTIADNFMFCKIMQDEETCKTFLEITLADKIRKISCSFFSKCYNFNT